MVFASKEMQKYYEFEYPIGIFQYRCAAPLPDEQYVHAHFTIRGHLDGLPGWQTVITVLGAEHEPCATMTCALQAPEASVAYDVPAFRKLVDNIWYPGLLLELDTHNPCVWVNDWSHNIARYRESYAPSGHWQRHPPTDEYVLCAQTLRRSRWGPPLGGTPSPEQIARKLIEDHREGPYTFPDPFLRDLPPILGENLTITVNGTTTQDIALIRQNRHHDSREKRIHLPSGSYSRIRQRPLRCRIPPKLEHVLSK